MNETVISGRPPKQGNTVSIISAITSITDGRKVVTTAGTRVQLSSTPIAVKRCTLTAETDNTGAMVVGGATVVAAQATRTGVPLAPGDSYELEINDLSLIYLDSEINGDGVTFNYFT